MKWNLFTLFPWKLPIRFIGFILFSLKSGSLVYLTYSVFFSFFFFLEVSTLKQCPVCVIIKEMFEICFIKDCSDLHITSVFKVYLVANDLHMINKGSGLQNVQ